MSRLDVIDAPINQRWFDVPGTNERARGESGSAALVGPDGQVIATVSNGGIAGPVETTLVEGTFIARIGSKRLVRPDRYGVLRPAVNLSNRGLFATTAAGEWWLDRDNYARVRAFAQHKGVGLPVAVRLLCCVPLEWSDLDMIVEATLKQPLRVYRGLANAAHVKAGKFTESLPPIPDHRGQQVEQLFIPGLCSPDVVHDTLMITRQQFLAPELGRRGYVIRPL
jgi:hypothetical protein